MKNIKKPNLLPELVELYDGLAEEFAGCDDNIDGLMIVDKPLGADNIISVLEKEKVLTCFDEGCYIFNPMSRSDYLDALSVIYYKFRAKAEYTYDSHEADRHIGYKDIYDCSKGVDVVEFYRALEDLVYLGYMVVQDGEYYINSQKWLRCS